MKTKNTKTNPEILKRIEPNPEILKRIELENKILLRYEQLKADDIADKMSLMMDLEYSNVDLDKLFEADDKTLLHDVNGIICNMDRKNKKLIDFIPRVGFRT